MSRICALIVILLTITLLPAPASVSAQQPDIVSVTNGIFEVFVQAANGDIGTYTIRTGANHPATISTGYPQEVFYGDDDPGTSFNTIRSYTTQTDYITTDSPTSEFSAVYLNPYIVETTIIVANEIQTVWTLPGPPVTPDKLDIVQKIKILGTNFSDSSVTVNLMVTNLGVNPVDFGVRYFWDYKIGADDGPTFSVSPGGSASTKETEFQLPTFSSYVIQDNDRNPNPPIFNVHGTVPGCGSIAPDILQFVDWARAYNEAFDYTVDPARNISESSGDSAVVYLFGSDATRAHAAGAQQTLSFVASIFADTPTYGSSGPTDIYEPDNTPSTGSPIIMGEEQRHTLCPQGDQDWVNFQASSTYEDRNILVETFDLEPDDINPNGNTKIIVKDSSQVQIGVNQDRGFAPPSGSTQPKVKSSRVVWHPATGGLFNINILPETPVNEQAGSGYRLRLANGFTDVVPVDQASWGPTIVNVPHVWRSGNVIYFTQYFTYEQAELDALKNLDTTLAWEFRRPDVVPSTGIEIEGSNIDFGDYWRFMYGVCDGEFWTNLPTNPTDEYSEESNLIPGCEDKDEPGNLDNEEFEVFIDDPSTLIANKVYYVIVKFYIHNSYLNSDYQFYISKAEHCKKQSWPIPDDWCNVIQGEKSSANLIEGYLQPAP